MAEAVMTASTLAGIQRRREECEAQAKLERLEHQMRMEELRVKNPEYWKTLVDDYNGGGSVKEQCVPKRHRVCRKVSGKTFYSKARIVIRRKG